MAAVDLKRLLFSAVLVLVVALASPHVFIGRNSLHYSQKIDTIYDQKVVKEISARQTQKQSCSTLDGPYCFQQMPADGSEMPGVERQALFISEEEYRAVRQVPEVQTEAAMFLTAADKAEAGMRRGAKTMTAYYMLRFDEIWIQKLPKYKHKDYTEQVFVHAVNFDEGLTNTMWVEGTLLVRLRLPKMLQQAIITRQRADYFQFGDAYEQAIMRVLEDLFDEDFNNLNGPLVEKTRSAKQLEDSKLSEYLKEAVSSDSNIVSLRFSSKQLIENGLNNIYAYVYSPEVVFKFKYPVLFDQIQLKVNQNFLSHYRSEHQGENPQFYIETYNEMGFRLARIEPPHTTTEWTLFTLPPDSNTKTSKLVISQGLEIDNLRMYMEFPVVIQYVRLQEKEMQAKKPLQ